VLKSNPRALSFLKSMMIFECITGYSTKARIKSLENVDKTMINDSFLP